MIATAPLANGCQSVDTDIFIQPLAAAVKFCDLSLGPIVIVPAGSYIAMTIVHPSAWSYQMSKLHVVILLQRICVHSQDDIQVIFSSYQKWK